MKTINIKLNRDKNQEDNISVFRWFENDDIIASIVQGYFSEECNLRVSFCWSDKFKDIPNFEIRGHKSIMLEWSDLKVLNWVTNAIERHINDINLSKNIHTKLRSSKL